MTPGHQQAAIKRLEALFKDVSLDKHQHKPRVVRIETKVDRCCEIHGDRYKENCAFRRNSPSSAIVTTTTITPTVRRGTLNMPKSPAPRDAHPSSFPSSLRRDTLGSSQTSISHKKDTCHIPIGVSPSIRRDSLGRSMSSLKKDASSSTSSSLRRDSMAKSMSSLQKPGLGKRDLDRTPSPVLTSTAKIREKLSSSGELIGRKGYGTARIGGLKSESKGVSLSNMVKDTRTSSSLSRRFSADSLENLHKRHSWDATRRGSSGSSGGWDDPIWEENNCETSVDEVNLM